MGRRVFAVVVAMAALVVWVGIVRIGAATDESCPNTFESSLSDGIPVTVYLPPIPGGYEPDERPPVVVAGHGYTGDRRSLHTMGTALCEHGYAVVTFDARGHGGNRHPFVGDRREDVVDIMDAVEHARYVDGDRIALLGHSMGANTVLDAATIDERPDAVIAVSGGQLSGDRAPERALLVIAGGDPDGTRTNAREIADALAGAELADIRGTNHLTVISNDDTISRTVEWLDETWKIDRGSDEGFPFVAKPLGVRPPGTRIIGYIAAIVVIAGAGSFFGRTVAAPITRGGPWVGLGLLAVALVVGAPIVRVAPLAAFVPLDTFNIIASYFLIVTGLLMWRSDVRPGAAGWAPFARAVAPALGATAVIYTVLAPLLSPLHRFVPTPERAVGIAIAALASFPFFAVVDSLVRRGGIVSATLGGVASRSLVVAALAIGSSRGLLPGVVAIGVPVFLLLFLIFEVFAFAAYAAGRNVVFIAIVESLWMGWLIGVMVPITI